jgi:hypothetical protein
MPIYALALIFDDDPAPAGDPGLKEIWELTLDQAKRKAAKARRRGERPSRPQGVRSLSAA